MSTQTPQRPAHTNGHSRELPGVRTYRGRKLEDLVPQIRAELGPDAIILRQREGLMGGVGGFFAQRCVEVDAQAPPRVDIYDEDHDDIAAPAPADDGLDASAPATDEGDSAQAASFVADVVPVVGPAEETVSVMPAAETVSAAPAEETVPATPAEEPPSAPLAEEPSILADPLADLPSAYESFAARLEEAAAHVDMHDLVAAVAPEPVDAVAVEPVVVASPEPVIPPEPVKPAAVPPAQAAWATKQAGRLDPTEAAGVAAELTSQGISDAWANELIQAAAVHRCPLTTYHSLRDAVRATLAATIPAPAPLPASGAAVAFVGAGGSGKTRCAAALAAAYARASTLAASVVSLGTEDWGSELKELLKGQSTWVTVAPRATDAIDAVSSGRDGGFVVVDTAAAAPSNAAAVEALAADLESLSLDGVYIAVPATFSVRAARKLVEGFEALGADGIAVTHCDEADQLGIAAELSYVTGMPIAYIHEGLDLGSSLSAADPSTLAARLLP